MSRGGTNEQQQQLGELKPVTCFGSFSSGIDDVFRRLADRNRKEKYL